MVAAGSHFYTNWRGALTIRATFCVCRPASRRGRSRTTRKSDSDRVTLNRSHRCYGGGRFSKRPYNRVGIPRVGEFGETMHKRVGQSAMVSPAIRREGGACNVRELPCGPPG